MANALLAYDDFVDRGTVTATDQLLTLPAVNLQHPHLSPRVWRTNTNTATINVDFGLDRAVDLIAMLGCNFTTAGTMRYRLDSDSAFAAPHSYDSGTIANGIDTFYDACVHILAAPVTARYLRVDLVDTGLTFLQAGRLFAASAWRLTRNFAFGFRETWEDSSRQSRAESGQVWIDRGSTYRTMDVQLPAVTESESRSHVARLGRLARARDVLFVTDPNSTNLGRDSIFGPFETAPAPRLDGLNRHSMSLTITERL